MSDIRICNDDSFDIDGKTITVCSDEEPFEPKDIKVCSDRLSCPGDDLVITGTDAPSVGSIYTASGGVPPYIFDISSGEINESTGEVTSLTGACGSGSVTVTDKCGTQVGLTVRFPSGKWITDEWHVGPSLGSPCVSSNVNIYEKPGSTCNSTSISLATYCGESGSYDVIQGDTKYTVGPASALTCGTTNNPTSTTTISNGGTCADGTRYNYPYNCVSYIPPEWDGCTYSGSCTDGSGTYEWCYELFPCYVTIYKWVCPC